MMISNNLHYQNPKSWKIDDKFTLLASKSIKKLLLPAQADGTNYVASHLILG